MLRCGLSNLVALLVAALLSSCAGPVRAFVVAWPTTTAKPSSNNHFHVVSSRVVSPNNGAFLVLRAEKNNDDGSDGDEESSNTLEDQPKLPLLALPPYVGIPRVTNGGDGDTLAFKSLLTDAQYDGNVAQTQFAPRKFQMQYTCNVCDHRNTNMVSRQAYREGVVISVCKGCQAKHMIADNLGWEGFGDDNETQNIEEFFQKRITGDETDDADKQHVNRVSIDAWDLEKLYRASSADATKENDEEAQE
jgi:hypothetical protein